MNKQEIQQALVAALKDDAEFVLTDFKWYRSIMDVMGIRNDAVSEYKIIESKEDLDKELNTRYQMGKIPVKKHDLLKKGKALQNLYWLVIPGKEVTFPVPEYAGIILVDQKKGLTVLRDAPELHRGFMPQSTYKHVARHFQALLGL